MVKGAKMKKTVTNILKSAFLRLESGGVLVRGTKLIKVKDFNEMTVCSLTINIEDFVASIEMQNEKGNKLKMKGDMRWSNKISWEVF